MNVIVVLVCGFFCQFLDRCTDAVHLPFAARKLFTKDGKELNHLSDLQRDELVYVSCGEPWSDPQMSHSEQQRRTVLANLAADVSHIRQYCALRDPTGIVQGASDQYGIF